MKTRGGRLTAKSLMERLIPLHPLPGPDLERRLRALVKNSGATYAMAWCPTQNATLRMRVAQVRVPDAARITLAARDASILPGHGPAGRTLVRRRPEVVRHTAQDLPHACGVSATVYIPFADGVLECGLPAGEPLGRSLSALGGSVNTILSDDSTAAARRSSSQSPVSSPARSASPPAAHAPAAEMAGNTASQLESSRGPVPARPPAAAPGPVPPPQRSIAPLLLPLEPFGCEDERRLLRVWQSCGGEGSYAIFWAPESSPAPASTGAGLPKAFPVLAPSMSVCAPPQMLCLPRAPPPVGPSLGQRAFAMRSAAMLVDAQAHDIPECFTRAPAARAAGVRSLIFVPFADGLLECGTTVQRWQRLPVSLKTAIAAGPSPRDGAERRVLPPRHKSRSDSGELSAAETVPGSGCATPARRDTPVDCANDATSKWSLPSATAAVGKLSNDADLESGGLRGGMDASQPPGISV
mmetsp:Transcript_1160/g.3223  ORF Transcript_1160/g.3223 Transcript_1160/m.3223 type:complete len:468 (-) Transcript_1160:440-1843(-)